MILDGICASFKNKNNSSAYLPAPADVWNQIQW